VKYYHLTVGAQGQAKVASTYDVTHKKPAPPKQKNFFRVQTRRLEDLPRLLSLSPGL